MTEKKTETRVNADPKGTAHASGEIDAKRKTDPNRAEGEPTPQAVIPARPKSATSPARPTAKEVNRNRDDRIEVWDVSRLRPHPRQKERFHDLKGRAFKRLVASMKKGLNHPIEVLPDGTVVDGHQRLRAARELGWTEIRVWVRVDLVGNQRAIDLRHIEANEVRRQLSMLDRARVVKARLETETGKECTRSNWMGSGLRDRIVEEVGCEKRHATRLINILLLPMSLQRAVDEGKLSLVKAAKAAALPEDVLESIAAEVESGGDPTELVEDHLPRADLKKSNVDKATGVFEEAVDRFLAAVGGREDRISMLGPDPAARLVRWKERWKELGRVVEKVIGRLVALDKEEKRRMKTLMNIRNKLH